MEPKSYPIKMHPRVVAVNTDCNPTAIDLKSKTFRAIHVALEELDRKDLPIHQRAKVILEAIRAAQTI